MRMLFGRLSTWTGTVFVMSVTSLSSSGCDVCCVNRLNLTLITLPNFSSLWGVSSST